MEASLSQSARPSRTRTEKGRRCWSQQEEDVLISGLHEIIQQGWKSENGFRPGFLNILEKYMNKAFPGTDLKATPHINSKIHSWKKNHASLFSMLSKSGIGLSSTSKMIEATDEAWAAYIKVDANAKTMRYKAWPLYEAWCEIFGRDRATGESAEGFVDAVNSVLNETHNDADNPMDGFERLFEELAETPEPRSVSLGDSSATAKTKTVKKRKAADRTDAVIDILNKFCQSTELRLGEIASRIGYEQDISKARKEVWNVVEQFDGLSLQDKLRASKLLVKNAEDLELFFSLPSHARDEFTIMKLSGHV